MFVRGGTGSGRLGHRGGTASGGGRLGHRGGTASGGGRLGRRGGTVGSSSVWASSSSRGGTFSSGGSSLHLWSQSWLVNIYVSFKGRGWGKIVGGLKSRNLELLP